MRTAIVITLLVACSTAYPQAAKRGAAGVGRALSDISSRHIDADLEVEIARRKAEIELEYQRRLRELDRPQAAAKPAPDPQLDSEEAALVKAHPQWERIVTSTAFDNWLETQSPIYNVSCRTTRQAAVLASCIEAFFGPPAPIRKR